MLPKTLFSSLGVVALAGSTGATPIDLNARDSSSFNNEMLAAHNYYRAQHGASPLRWNNQLANNAQNWANRCRFGHQGGPYGENIASSTGNHGPGYYVNMWGSERTRYNWNVPIFSLTAGHFTQVVWKDTKEVGCATRQCGGIGTYVVCEYNTPGNFQGRFQQNVGKQTSGRPSDQFRG